MLKAKLRRRAAMPGYRSVEQPCFQGDSVAVNWMKNAESREESGQKISHDRLKI
jgi:hypothetical protein